MTHYLDDFYYDDSTLYKLEPHYIFLNDTFYKRRFRRIANNRYRIHLPNGKLKDVPLAGLETDPAYRTYRQLNDNYIVTNNRLYQRDNNPSLTCIDNKVYRILTPNSARKAYQLYIRGHYVWVPIATLFPTTL